MNVRVFSSLCPIHRETLQRALGPSENHEWALFAYPTPLDRDDVAYQRERGVKVAAFWIGSDAKRLDTDLEYRGGIPSFDAHISVHGRLTDYLKKAGIFAPVVGFTTRKVLRVAEKREWKICAIYMPSAKENFMPEVVRKIVMRCPDVGFVFYGFNGDLDLPGNAVNLRRVSPEAVSEILSLASCVMRLTKHDGFPQNIIEAKMMAKNVISNYPYDGTMYAPGQDDAVQMLRDPKTHEADRSFWPARYRENYGPEVWAQRVRDALACS